MNPTEFSRLIDTLGDLTESLRDITTREKIKKDNAFLDVDDRKENRQAARDEELTEYLKVSADDTKGKVKEKKALRKISKDVLPINVVSVDKKVLQSLAGMMPVPPKTKKTKGGKEDGGFSWLSLLGTGLALLFAPFVLLVNFFKEISTQGWFKWLKGKFKGFGKWLGSKLWAPFKFVGDKIRGIGDKIKKSKWFKNLKNFFKPVTDFFRSIGTKISNTVKAIKGSTFGKILTKIKNFFTGGGKGGGIFQKIGGFFTKIGGYFKKAWDFVKKSKILRIAGRLGTVLGKLFYPIMIIMGVWDGIKGWMKGYTEDGIIGGIKGAVIGIFDGLVGGILRLGEDIIVWLLEAIGLDNVAKSLSGTVDGLLDPIYEMFGGVVDFIGGIFTLDGARIWAGVKSFFGGALDLVQWIIETPINLVVNFFKDIFGFGDPDKPFDFGDWFEEWVWGPIIDFFKSIGDWFVLLFSDPVAALKKLIPQWLMDFGGWIYDKTIGLIDEFLSKLISGDIKGAFKALIPDWLWDTGAWIYDNTIGRIVEFWDKLFSGDIKGAFKALIPDWLWDTGAWIYDNTIGRIAAFWTQIFSGDIKGAFKALIPDWIWNTGAWIYDHTIGPISDWFVLLFDDPAAAFKALVPDWILDTGEWIYDNTIKPISDWFELAFDDPLAAFKALVPDWLLDTGEWIYDNTIAPIADWFSDLFDFDFGAWGKNKMKKNFPKIYDAIWGDEDKAAAAQAAEKKALSGDLKSNISDATAIAKIVEDTQAAGIKAGGKTYGERTQDLMDVIDFAVDNSAGSVTKVLNAIPWSDQQKMLEVQAYERSTAAEKASGEMNKLNKAEQAAFWRKIASGYKDRTGTDNRTEWVKDLGYKIANTSAGLQLGQEKMAAGTKAVVDHMKSVGELQLGGSKIGVMVDGTVDMRQKLTAEMYDEFKRLSTSQNYSDRLYFRALKKVGVESLVGFEDDRRAAEAAKKTALRLGPGSEEFSDEKHRSVQALAKINKELAHLDKKRASAHAMTPEFLRFYKDASMEQKKMWQQSQLADFDKKEIAIRARHATAEKDLISLESLLEGNPNLKLDTDSAAGILEDAGHNITVGSEAIHEAAGGKEGFPAPKSPHAWEYLKMAGENIMNGAKQIYDNSNIGKSSKQQKDSELIKKVDEMVAIMSRHSEIHEETQELLRSSGLLDKAGNAVVDSSSNTIVNNSFGSGGSIMDFRNHVLGRISEPSNKY